MAGTIRSRFRIVLLTAMTKNLSAVIVKSGTWLYDNSVPHEIWVVKQNWEPYYDEGFEDEPEKLNDDGECFFVLVAKEGSVVSSISAGTLSLDEAITAAEKACSPPIVWDNHRLQPLFRGRYYELTE
jgi:hypothetical protein